MIKRLSQSDIDNRHHDLQKDRLFLMLYHPLSQIGREMEETLSFEDIWSIACQQTEALACSIQPAFTVNEMHEYLMRTLSEVQDENNVIHHRTQAETEFTAFCVEIVVMYRLLNYSHQLEKNPYRDYCTTIGLHLSPCPWLKEVLAVIERNDEQYEQILGSEMPEHDYIPSIIKENNIAKEAIQLSVDCAKYLAPNYTEQWLQDFWLAVVQQNKEQFSQDMESTAKYTTIYHIIGVLLKHKVYNATQTEIAKCFRGNKPSKGTIRRYISYGFSPHRNTNCYDKFINAYILKHKM